MKNEYEELPDGSLKETREIPGGRGISLFQACQNMMLAARAQDWRTPFARLPEAPSNAEESEFKTMKPSFRHLPNSFLSALLLRPPQGAF